MKNKTKLILFILIVFLLVVILKSTFSKYTNKSTALIKEDVGKWIIKINTTDITKNGGISTEFLIDNFMWNWDEVKTVKPPKVAPGMNGYFDLIIDPTDTDVSMEYTIEIDDQRISYEDINLKITSITEINNKEIKVTENQNGPEVIKRIKKLEEIQSNDETKRLDTIRVNVEWFNNEKNNNTDSEIGSVLDNIIKIPVTVNAIQYTGT